MYEGADAVSFAPRLCVFVEVDKVNIKQLDD
jgi:hypothetical protein